MLDTIILNGTIVDGSGKPGFTGDLGIEGGKIAFIGQAKEACASKTIDAAGKIVCPGIVDVHSHADLTVFREDHPAKLEPLVRQGITTFVGGNCGISMAPFGQKHREAIRQYIEVFTNLDTEKECPWESMGGFLDTLESRGTLLNTAVLAPHGLLRINQLGTEKRPATADEIESMAAELDRALEEGAIGLSAGLQYYPGNQSDTSELVRLGKVLKKHDGIFACHLRSYSNTLAKAIDEVLEVSRENGVRGQISHIFWLPDYGVFGPAVRKVLRGLIQMSKYWTPPIPLSIPLAQRIEQVSRARARGANVLMDVMPTTTAFTHLLAYFPPWAVDGGRDGILKRLTDQGERTRMRRAIEHGKARWPHAEGDSWSMNLLNLMGYECARIMAVVSEKNKPLEGRRLVDIARERGVHPFDLACDLLLEEEGHVLVFASMGEPEDRFTERSTLAPLAHPEVAISTDTILMGIGKPSHLFYGCYPKFIGRYVREMKMLSLETAIRKMTGLPAEHFQLKGRGRLEAGYHADVLIFDFDRIASRASFDQPDRFPVGIEHVFINGNHVLEGDAFRPEPRPGRVLRGR